MTETDGHPGNLAWWMNDRRSELRMKWSDVASAADITTQALRNARKGDPMRNLTKAAVEQALQWEKGSIDAIQQGRRPTPQASHDEDPLLRRARELQEESQRLIDEYQRQRSVTGESHDENVSQRRARGA